MLITKPEHVKEALVQLDGCEYFAFDTEFIRQTTFYPKLCLMQFASNKGCFAIDVTELAASSGWQEVKSYLSDFFSTTKSVLAVHAGEQDIEILNQQFAIPKLLFDTQLVARFIGFAGTPSYGSIVQHYCNVTLDKGLQYSRWDQRPLSDKHLEYAIRDVSYLHEIYPVMLQQLIDGGKIEWFIEEMVFLRERAVSAKMDNISELRQFIGMMDSRKQVDECYAILKAREITARTMDVAKQRLLSLDDIGSSLIAGEVDFNKLAIAPRCRATFLEVLEAVRASSAEWERDIESEWEGRGVVREKKSDKFFAAKDLLAKVAREYNINPELIASSKDIFKLLENKSSKINRGWRYQVFGEKAMELL